MTFPWTPLLKSLWKNLKSQDKATLFIRRSTSLSRILSKRTKSSRCLTLPMSSWLRTMNLSSTDTRKRKRTLSKKKLGQRNSWSFQRRLWENSQQLSTPSLLRLLLSSRSSIMTRAGCSEFRDSTKESKTRRRWTESCNTCKKRVSKNSSSWSKLRM